jgi:hypothetical protein
LKFILSTSALNDDDSVLSLIDRLVDRLGEEVHRLDVLDLDLLQESLWYQKARSTRRAVLMSALTKPPTVVNDRQGPHVKTVEVLDAESARLADKLAHTPLVILVEDRESDGVFLDLVVEELGWPALRALWKNGRTVTPRAAELDTAGGKGSIPQRIEKVCARGDVPYYIWKKRCAENYIPDEVFEAAREDPHNLNDVKRFDALLRRSPEQRDHFPVKDGLSAGERSQAIQAGLYNSSEEEDLALLEKPLFPKRPRPFLRLHRDRRESFTARGLRARDPEGELDAVLNAIAQEL